MIKMKSEINFIDQREGFETTLIVNIEDIKKHIDEVVKMSINEDHLTRLLIDMKNTEIYQYDKVIGFVNGVAFKDKFTKAIICITIFPNIGFLNEKPRLEYHINKFDLINASIRLSFGGTHL